MNTQEMKKKLEDISYVLQNARKAPKTADIEKALLLLNEVLSNMEGE